MTSHLFPAPARRLAGTLGLVLLFALALTACRDIGGSNATCSLGAGDRFRAHVIDVSAGGSDNIATDGDAAEGGPDCTDTTGFVSLGGGYILFDIGCQYPTGPGPDLKVWESGMCPGISETYSVYVSTDGAQFVKQADGFGDTDIDVTGVTEFRYVRLVDERGITSGTTPGPDIDALELLHAR